MVDAENLVTSLNECHSNVVVANTEHRELIQPGIDLSDEIKLSNEVLSSITNIRDEVIAILLTKDQEDVKLDNERKTLKGSIEEKIEEIEYLLKSEKLVKSDEVMQSIETLFGEFMSVTTRIPITNLQRASVEFTDNVDSSVSNKEDFRGS